MAKDSEIRFRVTEDFETSVGQAAEARGQTVSEFARDALQRHVQATIGPGSTGDTVELVCNVPRGLYDDMHLLTRLNSGDTMQKYVVSGLDWIRKINREQVFSGRELLRVRPELASKPYLGGDFYDYCRHRRG